MRQRGEASAKTQKLSLRLSGKEYKRVTAGQTLWALQTSLCSAAYYGDIGDNPLALDTRSLFAASSPQPGLSPPKKSKKYRHFPEGNGDTKLKTYGQPAGGLRAE